MALLSITLRRTIGTVYRLKYLDRELPSHATSSTLYQILVRSSSLLQHGWLIGFCDKRSKRAGSDPGAAKALHRVIELWAI
jgi:hypothetical protein